MTQEIIQKIKSHMAQFPGDTRYDICRALNIPRSMLDRMGNAGLVKLPRKLSASEAAKIGRKKAEAAGKRFVINRNKPQVWQEA